MVVLKDRIRVFLAAKDTSRGWFLVSGLVLLIPVFLIDWFILSETKAYRQEAVQLQLFARKIQEVRSYSIDFQTLGAAYVSAVLDRREDVNDHLEELRENVVAQHAALGVYAGALDETTLESVERYRQELQKMSDELATPHTVLSLRGFWEAASDLLVARNEVIRELDRQEKADQG